MLGRLQRCQLIVKCEMIMYTRGAPDPEFLDPAGSGSSMILDYSILCSSGVQKLLTDVVCHQQLNINIVAFSVLSC